MARRACPACGGAVIVAWVSSDVERTFDAELVHGGGWGIWQQTRGLNVVWRARAATPENHFGDAGHQLHECPGSIGQQMRIGAA